MESYALRYIVDQRQKNLEEASRRPASSGVREKRPGGRTSRLCKAADKSAAIRGRSKPPARKTKRRPGTQSHRFHNPSHQRRHGVRRSGRRFHSVSPAQIYASTTTQPFTSFLSCKPSL